MRLTSGLGLSARGKPILRPGRHRAAAARLPTGSAPDNDQALDMKKLHEALERQSKTLERQSKALDQQVELLKDLAAQNQDLKWQLSAGCPESTAARTSQSGEQAQPWKDAQPAQSAQPGTATPEETTVVVRPVDKGPLSPAMRTHYFVLLFCAYIFSFWVWTGQTLTYPEAKFFFGLF